MRVLFARASLVVLALLMLLGSHAVRAEEPPTTEQINQFAEHLLSCAWMSHTYSPHFLETWEYLYRQYSQLGDDSMGGLLPGDFSYLGLRFHGLGAIAVHGTAGAWGWSAEASKTQLMQALKGVGFVAFHPEDDRPEVWVSERIEGKWRYSVKLFDGRQVERGMDDPRGSTLWCSAELARLSMQAEREQIKGD